MSLFLSLNERAKGSRRACMARFLVYSICLGWFTAPGTTLAQTTTQTATPPTTKPVAVKSVPPAGGPPFWNELTVVQKETLRPLAESWNTMETPRKRKWLSVVQSYKTLTGTEQKILQSRMAEWAALSPQERTLARLNFSESKKVTTGEKTAKWDNYQALPSEDKKAFEDKSKLPRGAAVAPKTIPSNQLTQVPVTRHTAIPANAPPTTLPIDRKTLLPKAAAPPAKSSEIPQ